MIDNLQFKNYAHGMPVLRLKKLTGPGLVFVTTTVIEWLPIFEPPAIAREIALQLAETALIQDVSIVGYVVMPSHVHMLAGLSEISNLSSFVQSFKSLSSRRIRGFDMKVYQAQLYTSGRLRLWKRRFDDVIIVSEKQFRRKLDYIHENPVKAGLVRQATDWRFSSARDWLLDEVGEIAIVKDYGWIRC
jgi:REP element-mobilizing transposase RayT